MGKKLIVFSTILFLLFEVLYFQSNLALDTMSDQKDGNCVYQLAFSDDTKDFLENYQAIILEEKEQSFTVLTNNQTIEEIQKKYHITIEK